MSQDARQEGTTHPEGSKVLLRHRASLQPKGWREKGEGGEERRGETEVGEEEKERGREEEKEGGRREGEGREES